VVYLKCAIYCRVSVKDPERQNLNNQLIPLRKQAEILGCKIVKEYADRISGGDSNRPEFQEMLKSAERHEFDLLLIWSLDRFSREKMTNTLHYIERLNNSNVGMKSLQESWLDTRDEGIGKLLIAVFSWVARQERLRISERVKAGLKRSTSTKKRGKDKNKRKKFGYFKRWQTKKKGIDFEQ